MKLLWAPIIDSIFLRKIGRRKSWLIPVQYLLGFSFLILGFNINYWLVKTNKPHIYMLILMVFFTNFLAATQDIVVDGWALSMLKKENIGYVSMCNSAGQAFGIFLGYVLLIMLESESFCNNWLRLHPTSGGLITFQGYLYFWGCIFIMVTTLIAVLKSEKDNLHKLSCNNYYSMIETYKLLINIMRLPSIRMFALILITIKISFSSVDAAFNLKLINEGVSKDDLAAIELLLMPIRIILPFIITKFTSASKPLENYLISMLFRLVVGAASTAVIYITPYFLSQNENYTLIYKIILFTVYFLHELIVCVMIVNIMAFYARISDPKIGGTNMTLLSTIGNLGTSWSKTCAIWLIDFFTYKQCSNDDSNKCFYRYDTNICTKSGGTCRISVDGFYIEALICTIYGILWFFFFRKPIKKLQSKPINEWHVNK
ncbi:acetyl-coenzyme A transporter 1-like isoform X2 [Daktulosphaira vitifoliae]|nr:acetyl-coenzyme A transporter 1-like isoform X2 [Daktulosphaira vitifoliae]